ncbi:SdpI family protein [Tomitella cavernea]|uniref:SdpI family protein n=1 Tax=Tomitella cavernea TaxID=1387982 RepID=UPI0019042F0D|nr:SdpI family protein [Tomitella cavernea]
MVIAAIVFLVLAVVLGAVAAAALSGRLPRNRWWGLRTDATLRDDATFRAANRVAAPAQLGAAAVLVLGACGGLLLGDAAALFVVIAAPVVAVVLTAVGAGIAQRVAAAMPPADGGPCGHSCGACALQDSCASAVH